jgi:acetate---CoA ligase (ADP-forming)
MINKQLLNPGSIAVIGGSENIHKPGGKILRNLIDGQFEGELYVVNPRAFAIEGAIYHESISQLPPVDLAILAIPARLCPSATRELARTKNTRAFIVISAGFSEESPAGALLEKELLDIVNEFDACLIGPNCIGVLTSHHHSLFTSPIPELDPSGCDFISGSGATAVFIMESGIPKGLKFSSVFSVGNSAQTGVEEILQYMDEHYEPGISSPIKLLYMESIRDPDKLLHHASSLIRQGCKIAAIKSGSSDAGSRAATSHTGALASPDLAVEALFRKAGIVRCHSREELTTIASIFTLKEPKGKRIAIITHAGGPAVMLTDALTKGGLEVPLISGREAEKLKSKLLPGASVSNPIDLLATGTAEQLGLVIDSCENVFEDIDAMMVIFGSPGLVEVYDAYEVLHEKMSLCQKPIFPILPSMITARDEVQYFLSKGHVNFPDEVSIGSAMVKVMNTPKPAPEIIVTENVNIPSVRGLIQKCSSGYQEPEFVQKLLKAASIPWFRRK